MFDPEIERTTRKNNSRTRREKRLARLRQQEGTLGFISSSSSESSLEREEPMNNNEDHEDHIAQNQLPPHEGNGNQSVMLYWTIPRRLDRLGKQKTKQVEMKFGILQILYAHPFAILDHEDPFSLRSFLSI